MKHHTISTIPFDEQPTETEKEDDAEKAKMDKMEEPLKDQNEEGGDARTRYYSFRKGLRFKIGFFVLFVPC